ncbi:MAG: VOC family protein [Saprospiraceae bacterium]|nr:VOC family protein [Saprospiraceae bacterium]
MKQLNVYLCFPGNCEEALHFYQSCLGGDIVSLQRFGDSAAGAGPEHAQRVMHAEFKSDGIYLMASDSMPDQPIRPGEMVQLSINLTDAAEQESIFNRLAEGGQVTMPLQDTFWGASFGMLVDKYGISWMLNRDHAPAH